eukprot:1159748-Pelagomonas_calceolata.AAC.5
MPGGSQGMGPGSRQNPCQNGVLRKLPPGLPDQQRWLGTLAGALFGGLGAWDGVQKNAYFWQGNGKKPRRSTGPMECITFEGIP